MFCKTCGEKLESQNQKFCASCGSVLLHTPGAPQLRAEENQVSSTVRSVPVYESKSINAEGPGLHSKRCFAFAIVSLVLAIVGFISGGLNLFRFYIPSYYYPYYPGGLVGGLVGLSIVIILHIAGIVFGILSRTNSSKAGKFEPINTLEKVGSVFAVFGIVMNSIPIVVIPIIFIVIPIMMMSIIP
ncbi:MAG: hypothetical protein KAW66_05610 [Candidatus Lokiarchaeota archaeon]|jgi:hypothetical protein|nr:hypothetical protein [Candidatus Lokiarchaeota archaeon]